MSVGQSFRNLATEDSWSLGTFRGAQMQLTSEMVAPFKGGQMEVNEGLPKAWERILEKNPDLSFNREIAEQVLAERVFPHQLDALKILPVDATLLDLLKRFRADSSREEFLEFYIEALGGKKAFSSGAEHLK